MDALPAVGHACGHNLIAIAGVAVACAIKAVLEKFSISATIQLLGTPGAPLTSMSPIVETNVNLNFVFLRLDRMSLTS